MSLWLFFYTYYLVIGNVAVSALHRYLKEIPEYIVTFFAMHSFS